MIEIIKILLNVFYDNNYSPKFNYFFEIDFLKNTKIKYFVSKNNFFKYTHFIFNNPCFGFVNSDWSPEKTHSEKSSMGSYFKGGEKSIFITRQIEADSSMNLSDSFHSQIENKSTRSYRHKLYKRIEDFEYKELIERWKNEAKMKKELKANKFIIRNSKTKIEIAKIESDKIHSKKVFEAKNEMYLRKQEKKRAWKETRKLWKRIRES